MSDIRWEFSPLLSLAIFGGDLLVRHRPGHSSELVGQRDGSHFGRPSCQQRCDPGPILGAMNLGIADDGDIRVARNAWSASVSTVF